MKHISEPQVPCKVTTVGASERRKYHQSAETHSEGRDSCLFFPSAIEDTERGNMVPMSRSPHSCCKMRQPLSQGCPHKGWNNFKPPMNALSASCRKKQKNQASWKDMSRWAVGGHVMWEKDISRSWRQPRSWWAQDHWDLCTETCPKLLIQGRTRALYFQVTKFLLMTLKRFLTTFYKSTSSSSFHNSTCNLIKRQ